MINEAKRKIIIDTDPGHDDALAIVLLEKSNLFDIQCITTVAGNSSIQNVTNNTRYILDLIKSKIPTSIPQIIVEITRPEKRVRSLFPVSDFLIFF